jgi:hypothetical protein
MPNESEIDVSGVLVGFAVGEAVAASVAVAITVGEVVGLAGARLLEAAEEGEASVAAPPGTR